ncbi:MULTISPECIES: LysR substrate-binding domain-containing protein [unclassified Beijerinckia]|uniref:LysR substrate-binding domain-containing protein n=1 Tax=unclassified Beijerinckia TaxID=2638183 RepID=UPI000896810D|nr:MULTISPECIES: LysR substrate-binding domain-containing protein [unclassified Beijerinckia]MDH7795516.1 DNA-binding transcriptional LysR family regulator [Beijerinckia sp. GAS462]SEC04828.1 DNA-binding transcriptional regulator, LysR family [Beijerinckia sp. 28-YEA-48]
MLDLNDLRLFVQVADHGGFAAAGRVLDMPRSTLAKRIGDFEAQLGLRLFQRHARLFALTEIGRELYDRAQAMLVEAEAAESLIQGRLVEPAGLVRLTASTLEAQTLLADILPDFAQAYPKVFLQLDATDRLVDLIEDGVDLALRTHYGPLPSSSLVQRRLGVSFNHLVCSPAYLEGRSRPRSPAELTGHLGIWFAVKSTALPWRFYDDKGRVFEGEATMPCWRFVSNDPTTLLNAAIAGLGIASLPARLCAPALAAGQLTRLLDGWQPGGPTLTLLTPHRRGQLPAVRALSDFLAERLTPLLAKRHNS